MRIAVSIFGAAALSLVAASPGRAQASPPEQVPARVESSPECRVPPSDLFVPSPLPHVTAVVASGGPLTVLAIGGAQRRTGSEGQAIAPYPVRLQGELERALHVTVAVTARRLREITARAGDTVMSAAGEVRPDLVVWQAGINDALAHSDVSAFAEAVDELLKWLRAHDIDVILVEPPY